MTEARPTLYTIPLSHSACTARLSLEHKGLDHRTVELISGLHRPLLWLMGFRPGTVPALRYGARRLQGTLEISRLLEETVPEPPLYPRDPERRGRIEAAERWGEEELQPVPRRLARWGLVRRAGVRRRLAELNRLPLPGVAAPLMRPVAAYYARLSGATDDGVRRDLERLPGQLDRVEAWISDGVLDGERLGAADYQIGPSLRLLMNFEDLRPLLEDRPAGRLALRVVAEYPGAVPAFLPRDWIPGRDAA